MEEQSGRKGHMLFKLAQRSRQREGMLCSSSKDAHSMREGMLRSWLGSEDRDRRGAWVRQGCLSDSGLRQPLKAKSSARPSSLA